MQSKTYIHSDERMETTLVRVVAFDAVNAVVTMFVVVGRLFQFVAEPTSLASALVQGNVL